MQNIKPLYLTGEQPDSHTNIRLEMSDSLPFGPILQTLRIKRLVPISKILEH